jgi:multiple sugar transport system permease protein
VIAFQDYRFLEDSRVVGVENFARVLYSEAFWLAMWRTAQYTALAVALGFIGPILLAALLHELPRGSLFFRVLYYLPALTTGIVVIFLWKSFYDPGPSGLLNYLLSFARIAPRRWLDDPSLAMLCCILPTVWAGLGVGCLVYLAALKSIPAELYEASALDGCGVWGRFRHVSLPYLRPLIIINFMGVIIGAFHSAGYILVLTGGGPSDATNVVSLEIFYEAYARLALGSATAMSWILALILIGFTLYQIRYMAKLEFRSAGASA